MTKLRLVLLASTALTAMQFVTPPSHATDSSTVVMAQAKEELGPDGKPKPKPAPPAAAPPARPAPPPPPPAAAPPPRPAPPQFGLGTKQPNSSFSSNTSSSIVYGGPFNQLGSSSIRLVIRSSPSTLSALETSRGPSFTATTTRVPMSVQRNAPACVQNVSPIAKSLSSIVAIRLSRIVTPSPADLINRARSEASSLFPWRLPSAARSRHEGGRGGGTIASGPAAPSTIGMMMAEVHGRSSPRRTPWL